MALTQLTDLQPTNIKVTGIATFDQTVGIAGTLTYQDVTNVDAVGILTARSGINVTGGILNITNSENTLGILSSTDGGANLDIFDDDTQTRIRTTDGKLHLYADMGNSVSDSAIRFFVDGANEANEKVRITSAGNVGIGTDNPSQLLHLEKNSYHQILLKRVGASPSEAIFANAGNYTNIKNNATGIKFSTGATPESAMVIRSSGLVGIGTDNPDRKLTVAADSASAIIELKRTNTNTTGSFGAISWTAMDGHSVANMYALGDGNNEGAHLVFRTTSAAASNDPYNAATVERLRIASDGKIYVGGNGASATSGELWFNDTSAYSSKIEQVSGSSALTFHTGQSQPERLRIGSNGLLTVTTTGQSSGIKLVDSSNSSGSPNFEIISKRSDSNVNTAFSSNIFLGSNRTDQKVANNKFLGTVAFGGNHTDGTEGNISYAAAITARSSGDFNSKSDMPTDLIFTTGTSGTDRDGEAAGQSNVGTERLRINSRGAVTKPDLPSFHSRPPASYSLGDNVNAVVGGTWTTNGTGSFVRGTLANGNSIWNNTNGIFTVPVTGIYFLHWTVFLSNNSTRRDAFIYVNGTGTGNIIARTEIQDDGSGMNKSVAVSTVLSLSVNDTVRFGARTSGGTTIYQTAAPWSYACGHLIG